MSIVMSDPSNTTAPAPTILVANDQEWTARSLESILAPEGYQVVRAYTGQQALDRAFDSAPDLIILDTQLPDLSGPEVCRRLRQDPRVGWSVPIILTTAGSNGRTRMLEAMEAGAWDFAAQPFDGPALLARLRTYLNAKAAHDQARASATLDPATGLYNSRGLAIRITEQLGDARRRRQPVTCLVLSANSPEVQAALGLVDETAATLAEALRAAVRGSDAVARLSALDFAVLAANLDRESAPKVLERFQRHLQRLAPGGAIPVRAGLATIDPGEPMDPAELVRRATSSLDWSAAGAVAVSR